MVPREPESIRQRTFFHLSGRGGTWHGFVTMGRDETGKAVRRHVRGRTKGAVTERVVGLEMQRAGSAHHAATNARQTLGDWLDEWLLHIKAQPQAADLHYLRRPDPHPLQATTDKLSYTRWAHDRSTTSSPVCQGELRPAVHSKSA